MTAIPTSQPSDYGATDSSAPAPAPDMWPTPQRADGERGSRTLYRGAGNPTLLGKVKDEAEQGPLWPTPRAYSYDESHTPGLTTLDIRVRGLYPDKKRYWPTPRAEEAAHPGRVKIKDGQQMHLSAAVREDVEPPEDAPAPSTSSTGAHPASPLAQRVSALVRATAGGAGPNSSESLASYSPAGYWQRIQPALFPCDMETGSRPLDEYSQSWPRWGTALAGASGALLMSALRTGASASSSSDDEQTQWSTPRVAMASIYAEDDETFDGRGKETRETLARQAARTEQGLWSTPTSQNAKHGAATPRELLHRPAHLHVQASAKPTPRASDGEKGGPNQHHTRGDLMLSSAAAQAENWATPTVNTAKNNGAQSQQGRHGPCLDVQAAARPGTAHGQLNPAWVCGLMGFPLGWLDIPGPPAPARRSTRGKRPVLRRASPSG